MTPLRQRMLEDMQLRAFSPRTQEAYVYAVHRLAQHFHKSPDLITDEELRQYFLHLTQVQHYARATVTIALCGIKFFVEHTLGKTFTSLSLMRPPQTHKLPVVLSREEVWRILSPRAPAGLPRLSHHHLRLWPPAPGRGPPPGDPRGQRSPARPCHREGPVRPLRAARRADPHAAARPLAHASLPAVALSRPRPTGHGLPRRARGRPHLRLQPAVRLPSRAPAVRRATSAPTSTRCATRTPRICSKRASTSD